MIQMLESTIEMQNQQLQRMNHRLELMTELQRFPTGGSMTTGKVELLQRSLRRHMARSKRASLRHRGGP